MLLAKKIEDNIKKKSVGEFLPSESDLLIKYKTSRNTLRSALGVLRDNGYIESKAGIGTKIIASAPKKTNSQKRVQVLLPNTGYQFFYEIMDGINSVLNQHQVSLLYKNCNNDFAMEQKYLQEALLEDFDGLIYMSYFYADQIHFPEELNRKKNVVMVNNKVEGFEGSLICSEDEQGAYEAVSYMISKGYEKIIHLGGAKCSSHQRRNKGYLRAMSDKNLELHVYPVGSDYEAAYKFVKKNYKRKKLAEFSFFCANDFSALGCCKALEELGVKLSSRVSVAGFGGLDDQISRYPYPLITVKQDAFLMGKRAAEVVIDQINFEEKHKRKQEIFSCEISMPVKLIKNNLVVKK